MKTPTISMDVTMVLTLTKTINIPANWNHDQIYQYMFNLDTDDFYANGNLECTNIDWKNHKEKKNA